VHSEQQKAADMSGNLRKILIQNEEKGFTLGRSKTGTCSLERQWELQSLETCRTHMDEALSNLLNWQQQGRKK